MRKKNMHYVCICDVYPEHNIMISTALKVIDVRNINMIVLYGIHKVHFENWPFLLTDESDTYSPLQNSLKIVKITLK